MKRRKWSSTVVELLLFTVMIIISLYWIKIYYEYKDIMSSRIFISSLISNSTENKRNLNTDEKTDLVYFTKLLWGNWNIEWQNLSIQKQGNSSNLSVSLFWESDFEKDCKSYSIIKVVKSIEYDSNNYICKINL